MKKKINCFIPFGNPEDTMQTVKELQASKLVNKIYLLSSDPGKKALPGCECVLIEGLYSTNTMNTIAANAADADFILFYMKQTPLKLGLYALERIVEVMKNDKKNGIVYADRYQLINGELKQVPVIDYQLGSVRDDFDFGSMLFFNSSAFTEIADILCEEYEYAGLYAIRLFMSYRYSIVHINEYLYTEIETDARKSGEKQFDYVNPKNREVQIEMELACAEYLKCIDAYLMPFSSRAVNLHNEDFEFEASVIIPVRNRVHTIRDAVNSALNQQTTFPFNVIVIDNHSTDGTTETLQELSTDKRLIHLIPQENDLGIGGCWNKGVYHEKCGKFAIQLDSDDLYKDESTLQKIVDTFYKENCAMVIGTYLMTDFQLNEIAPGIIDHKEWTPENGKNNALRINGLGAPRAFYTPILRNIKLPNTSYGEDYAIGLSISREYKIGRIYDVIYLCRRWEGNSDAALSIEKVNQNNFYKDKIRTWEIKNRIQLHSIDGEFQELVEEMIEDQKENWELAKSNYEALEENLEKEEVVKLKEGDNEYEVYFFPNPQRTLSTIAKTDSRSIQERPCFLCKKNRPAEQTYLPFGHYEVCLNPYPIFQQHLTIIDKEHTPQSMKGRFEDMLHLAETLDRFYILYNGPECGASAPDHMHFQAAGKEEKLNNPFAMNFLKNILENQNSITTYVDNVFTTCIGMTANLKIELMQQFERIYQNLSIIYPDKEPLINIMAWYGLDKLDPFGYDEIKVWNCIIFLRSKHRPDCYYDQSEKGLLISPAIAEMGGIFPIARVEDMNKLTTEELAKIYKEVSLSPEQLDILCDQLFKKKQR